MSHIFSEFSRFFLQKFKFPETFFQFLKFPGLTRFVATLFLFFAWFYIKFQEKLLNLGEIGSRTKKFQAKTLVLIGLSFLNHT